MSVELDTSEAQAIVQLLDGLIRERAAQGGPTTHGMIALWRRLDNAITVSSRRQSEALRLKESGVSIVGTRWVAEHLGWTQRRVQRRYRDLHGQLVGDRLQFDERTVREYAKALQDRENRG